MRDSCATAGLFAAVLQAARVSRRPFLCTRVQAQGDKCGFAAEPPSQDNPDTSGQGRQTARSLCHELLLGLCCISVEASPGDLYSGVSKHPWREPYSESCSLCSASAAGDGEKKGAAQDPGQSIKKSAKSQCAAALLFCRIH